MQKKLYGFCYKTIGEGVFSRFQINLCFDLSFTISRMSLV